MTPQELASKIAEAVPGAKVDVEDMTGTMNHYSVVVVAEAFEGKSRVERHNMVFDPLKPYFSTNELHALTLKAWTPQQYEARKG